MTGARIAIASCKKLPDREVDDMPFVEALAARGAVAETIPWDDAATDWSAFDACVIRTTWDYTARRDEFVAWARRVAATTPIFNPPDIIEWNTHKGYLRQVASGGVPIIDTVWLDRGTDVDLEAVLRERGWQRGFMKPAVGASSESTCRFDRTPEALSRATTHARSVLASHDLLLQPYLESVESEGEASAILIDGVVTHCVRKIPVKGDYRVQDDYGASDELFDASEAFLDIARRAGACAADDLLYARADFLLDGGGHWRLTELELVEPSLFFRHCPEAAEHLATSLLRRLA